MYSLYLDTTTKEIRILLIKNDNIVSEKQFASNDNSENQFIGQIDKLLKENKLGIDDIDNLIVNVGPGGFTGTRISVAFANALKLARPELKLFGISNPESPKEIFDILKGRQVDILSATYYSGPSITRPNR